MKTSHAFAAAAALFLCTAPFSIAQTAAPNPPTAATPATPGTPATPADPSATPANPADSPAAAAPPAVAPPAAAAPPAMSDTADASSSAACRTHKGEGERCSCLSAPTNFGTAQSQNGHNVCVVPKT